MTAEVYIPIIISALSLVVSLTTYLITRHQLRLTERVFEAENDHNRRQIALDLLLKWDTDTLEARKHVMAKWSDKFYSSNVISWLEIESVRDHQLTEYKDSGVVSTHHLVTDHMTTILNYFDLIAVSVINNIADKTILEHTIMKTFQRWYLILNEFRRRVNDRRGYRPWYMAEQLYKNEWHPDKKMTPLKPVGN